MSGSRSLFGIVGIAIVLAAGFTTSTGLAQTTDVATADEAMSVNGLMDRTIALVEAGRFAEAEPVARQAVAAAEQAFGADHSHTGIVLAELAGILHRLERLDESERLYRRILAIFETGAPGDEHGLATALNNLAEALRRLNRLDEAEQMHRRALALYERLLPEGHPDIGASLNNLAGVIQQAGRFAEAEELFRRALEIREAALAADDPVVALSLTNLAVVLQHLNALDEAESMHRRALAIYEAALPDDHPTVATSLNNLAGVLWNLGRYEEAERLHRRALALRERVLPENHPDLAMSLSNLGSVLQNLGRYAEAEALDRRALAIYEKSLPADHPDIAAVLNNLAMVLQRLERFGEAATLHRRALAIREAALPPDHPVVALSLSNLASVLQNLGDLDDAEEMHRRALAIQERALPENHPDLAQGLENLSVFLGAWRGGFAEALALIDRSAHILAARENRATVAYRGWRERAFFRNAFGEAIWLGGGVDGLDTLRAARRGAFLDLQWERTGGAGGAIAAATARAQADPDVATLARERDRMLAEIARLDDMFVALSSDPGTGREERAQRLPALRAQAEAARRRLAEIDREIAQRFPAYSELAEGAPLSASEAVTLLAPDEVLVSITPFGEHGLFFAYGADGGHYAQLAEAAGAAALAARLRCSAAGRLDPACAGMAAPIDRVARGAAAEDGIRGADSLQRRADAGDEVFDLDLAHDLYIRLFPEEVRGFLKGKKLIVAPAPELMALPWHLLVTEAPSSGWNASGAGRAKAYREAKWLFQSHPSITVLPTIASLRALRNAAPHRATADRAFLGVGDPVIGRTAAERDAAPMECAAQAPILVADAGAALARSAGAMPGALFAGARDADGFGLADADLVRSQPRLADTRCELAAVAGALGGTGEATDLLLGADASESRLRELDAGGELSRYRVLHFATHGLLGGELGLGEPGLVLTPPDRASSRDDGILTASEIATLTLAADWVVLSACNTAAGSEADAEALSGLARSFFYAGARSLLVSSWPVYSPAAVDITTRAFSAMNDAPGIGRAEALTIAMRDTLADARTEQTAHPAYWGPFFLVGEGAQ